MRKIPKLIGFFFFLPLVVGFESNNFESNNKDSTITNFRIAGGQGSYAYVTRGCEGRVLSKEKITFKDVGFSIDHKFKKPVRIGLRAGYILDRYTTYMNTKVDRGNYYVNPDLSFESKWVGIGAGPFLAKEELYVSERSDLGTFQPSWHLRLGTLKSYLSISMLENLPLYSGGGYLDIGIGSVMKSVSWRVGVGIIGPYDGFGLSAKTSWRVHRNWYLDMGGRVGSSEGISENALYLGLNYRIFGKK